MISVEECKQMFHGTKDDMEPWLRPQDAVMYERLKEILPVEVKSLPPPGEGSMEQRSRLIVYLHKLVVLKGWCSV